ncbi:MAG: CRISPR-associated protein Cas4 [Chitinophagales bacterium]|nr:CRISPR-associated protein Cas4 [Chitinophagales bacterium]
MFSITPSHIIQHLYCPRFTFYEYVLRIPQFEEKQYKVIQGREMHDRKEIQNAGYLRRRIGAQAKLINCYLTNNLLRGEVDEVLELTDGTMAPLDYKFAKWEGKLYDTYRTQLMCYAWLIEENFGKAVAKGYLVYTRSKNYLLEVPIIRADLDAIRNAATEIRKILKKNWYPRATKVRKRCEHCTYRNICTQ